MPPKSDVTAPVSSKEETFLIACIKNGKEKLEVDYDKVALATGMSKGGAANKFRAIMKKFEDEGAAWTKSGGETPTKAKKTPVKRARPEPFKVDGDAQGDAFDEENETPTKKVATNESKAKASTKKAAAAAPRKKAVVKSEETVMEEDGDSESITIKKENGDGVGVGDGEGDDMGKEN